MQDLNVTLVQSELVWEDIEANLAQLDQRIDAIAPATDLIILPEMFSTGFSMNARTLAEPMDGRGRILAPQQGRPERQCDHRQRDDPGRQPVLQSAAMGLSRRHTIHL